MNNVGSNGNYWSSSPNSTDNGYYLNFNSGNLNPLNNNNRSNGFSARCVRQNSFLKHNDNVRGHVPLSFPVGVDLFKRAVK